ncbi:PTS sugar transporter subunit IIA [Cellulomonas sp. C5510]|uniref:PTS sugar transporter subunit IIA n=1 Tax=Cellulomonas sp. C5510 TaxID=2871170 RepID=UPI001C965A82|nr:PTS sugar transporter subunit IIA [Cellulomonas sp. C5510]QZN86438.1 PTS sugar transporter subunit IIA [Cellulomonas sp. C5510]
MGRAIGEDLVRLDVPAPASKAELFRAMAQTLAADGRIDDVDDFLAALEEREQLGPTYMGDGLALPHGRGATVRRPSVAFWRLAEPLTYTSCGETGEVRRVFMLAVPEGGATEHLQALALLARLLMDDDAVHALDVARTPAEAVDVVVAFARARETQPA